MRPCAPSFRVDPDDAGGSCPTFAPELVSTVDLGKIQAAAQLRCGGKLI